MKYKYIYKLGTVKDGVKFLMDNQDCRVNIVDNEDKDYHGFIELNDNDEICYNFFDDFDYYGYVETTLKIDSRKAYLDGNFKYNFITVCNLILKNNNLLGFEIKFLRDLYIFIKVNKKYNYNIKTVNNIVEYCKYVYYDFLKEVIEDSYLEEKDKQFLNDLFKGE